MTKEKNCAHDDKSCQPKKYRQVFNADFLLIAITTTVTYSFYMVLTVALLA